ncbi:MAG: thermonuclease family protein [Actinomycetota bacterium]|nr:thermonuclease family protein [Actinomycetota bacterium]
MASGRLDAQASAGTAQGVDGLSRPSAGLVAFALLLAVTGGVGCTAGTALSPPQGAASTAPPTHSSQPEATPTARDAPPATALPALPAGLDTTVTRVVDGDTLYLADLPERLRLIGIDTPETRHPKKGVECFGHEASRHLAELVPPGARVRLEFDVDRDDRYGRPLAYVSRADDPLHVNLAMVRDGYAQAYTVPPNVRYSDQFVAAQRGAREAGRGLWGTCE